ncbi:hypothetical protein BDA99DRAFT_145820 [Phascolomyces articulosus]|uniref:Uncharacterized protein n=1 Tax=Phascolomyces articulosus TaxID=60185 RepID=A0AAD5PB45_9FUNG|nr:hypothetical protein BDA99DRAFT_145820 [Phascolomyces articulosus]
MSGTENEAPASLPTSPLGESKSSRDSSPIVENSPLKPVTNFRNQTPEKHLKKRAQTPDYKVYTENVAINQRSTTPSPLRSPLSEKSTAMSPTIVVPAEHGRRSPTSTRPKSPPSTTLRKPAPFTEKVREALHDNNNQTEGDIKQQVANLRKQLQERKTRLGKLNQQKNEKDEQLRKARSETIALQKKVKQNKIDLQQAEATLQRNKKETENIKERVQQLTCEINDHHDIIQEFVQLTGDAEREAVDKEKELDDLMNMIPEKLVRIEELKQLLGEQE